MKPTPATTGTIRMDSAARFITPSGESILVSIEHIDAEAAAAYLATQTRNRKLRAANLKRITTALRTGEYHFTPDSIAFDTGGHLIDGQHRLHGIVQTGIPMVTFVMRGFPPATQDNLDLGSGRTVWEQMGMDGVPNANLLVACINTIARGFAIYDSKVTITQARAIVAALPMLPKAIEKDSPKLENRSAIYLGIFALALHLKAPGAALAVARLYDAFTRGIGIKNETDPAYQLRQWARAGGSFGGQQARNTIAFTADCIEAAVKGERLPSSGRTNTGMTWLRNNLPQEFAAIRRACGLSEKITITAPK